ncbi:hypothetical protein pb186bvf_008060 [Paramecium bursaria]
MQRGKPYQIYSQQSGGKSKPHNNVPQQEVQNNNPDIQNEFINLELIFKFITKIGKGPQLGDVAQFKHSLKTVSTLYLPILQVVIKEIDPSIEIKQFSDEKVNKLLIRLGYPKQNMSKTRFTNLGNQNSYYQSVGLLAFFIKKAEQFQILKQQVEQRTTNPAFQSHTEKMNYHLQKYSLQAYAKNIYPENDKQLNKVINETRIKVVQQQQELQQELQQITYEYDILNAQKISYSKADQEIIDQKNKIQEMQREIEIKEDLTNEASEQNLLLQQEIEQKKQEVQYKDQQKEEKEQLYKQQCQLYPQLPAVIELQQTQFAQYNNLGLSCDQLQEQCDKLKLQQFGVQQKIQNKITKFNRYKPLIHLEEDILINIPRRVFMTQSDQGIWAYYQEDDQSDDSQNQRENFQELLLMNDPKIVLWDAIIKQDQEQVFKILLDPTIKLNKQILKEVEDAKHQLNQNEQDILIQTDQQEQKRQELQIISIQQKELQVKLQHTKSGTEIFNRKIEANQNLKISKLKLKQIIQKLNSEIQQMRIQQSTNQQVVQTIKQGFVNLLAFQKRHFNEFKFNDANQQYEHDKLVRYIKSKWEQLLDQVQE